MNKEEKIRVTFGPNGFSIRRHNRKIVILESADKQTVYINTARYMGKDVGVGAECVRIRNVNHSMMAFAADSFALIIEYYIRWKQYGQQQALDKLNNKNSGE